jgi:protocatechuate 3,4-dioxygenase beta subunit
MIPFTHLTRRGFVATAAAALIPAIGRPDSPTCTLTGEQEEGPYYVPDEKLRQDITEGKPGVPLQLRVALVDSRTCRPLANAALDIWHCDALGVYSGFTGESPDGGPGGGRGPGRGRGAGPGGPPPDFDPDGFGPPPPGAFGPGGPGGPGGRGRGSRQIDPTRFLRGVQITNKDGLAQFTTVYPGWYSGRAIHIHLKAHLVGVSAAGDPYSSGHVAHTGQLFFPEDLTERIAKLEPYSKRLGVHRTTQAEDHVFTEQHGSGVMLAMERIGKRSDTDGFVATIRLAVDAAATPPPVGMGGGGRGRGGPGRPF